MCIRDRYQAQLREARTEAAKIRDEAKEQGSAIIAEMREQAQACLLYTSRHIHFHLDGSGPAKLEPPKLADWPAVTWVPDVKSATRVDLNTLTKEQVAAWKPGQKLLLNGRMLTGRDAAHKRISDMLAKGEKLPVDLSLIHI